MAGPLLSLGHNIWCVQGPELVFAGAPMHTRMVVVRLANNTLWVHSPTKITPEVRQVIENLQAPVSVLIAPNKFHHLFVESWQQWWPNATVYAESGLQKRIKKLAVEHTLTNEAPAVYADEIDQVLFQGNPLFSEAVFFHKPSATLILTDLFINLKTDKIPLLPRLFLQFEQVTYPNGGAPRLLKWLTFDRKSAKDAATRILAWQPEQMTFCHGEPFSASAMEVLNKEFAWLVGSR